jgi:hypothetical protein
MVSFILNPETWDEKLGDPVYATFSITASARSSGTVHVYVPDAA